MMSVARATAILFLLCAALGAGQDSRAESPRLAADASLERIAFGSCLRQDRPQKIWNDILAVDPQLFLMIGDNVYGDVSSSEMRELRAAYAVLDANPDFRRARSSVPFMAIWDDHDYGANDAGAEFPLKEEAKRLFREFWQIPETDPRAGRAGLYTSRIVGPPGRRVQIVLLDTRTFRSPLKRTDRRGARGKERYLPDADPAKTILGPAQWAWLTEELRRPADLRLIISSIQVLADGHGWERWGNLPNERQKLYDLIRETGAGRVVFLSGDRHRAALYRNTVDGAYPLHEITSSSLNLPFADPAETGPHQLGKTFGRANFGVIAIDWKARRLALEIRGSGGGVERSVQIGFSELEP